MLVEGPRRVLPPPPNHISEGCIDGKLRQFALFLDRDDAVVIITLDYLLAYTIFEEGRVWEDKFASFYFLGTGRDKMLHQPLKVAVLHDS